MARSPARRDFDRGPIRRRSRSRERDRRNDDRHDSRRHDRYDNRDRDFRGPPRDRSRDRKRSRDHYRADRADDRYAPDPRPSKRPRRDDSPPPRRSSASRRSSPPRRPHRDDDRDRRSGRLTPQQEKEVVDPAVAAEAAKKEKLAKVEAWKKKILEKKRLEGGGSGSASPQVTVQTETSAISPDAGSPAATSQPSTGPGSPAAANNVPTSYAGKFDPKAIAARAALAMERQRAQSATLGGDIVIPKSANQASQVPGGRLADSGKTVSSKFRGAAGTAPRDAKISGFGLSKTAEKQDKLNVGKGAAPMEEVEAAGRKLEKLPDMPHDTEIATLANVSDGQDDGDVDDLRSDDEEAELVREAALKRAEEAQAEEMQQDDPMTGVVQNADGEDVEMQDEEEEVDPLDAFMNGLEQPADNLRPNLAIGKGKKKQPQVFNSDDEDDMDALEDDTTDDILAMAAKRKKKDIPKVDHSKIDYEPFRKSFYSESVELADMTAEEVEELRADLDNIKCRGINVPKPIMKWSQGGFGAQILDVIREQKYEKPTSIQSQALPAIMSGRDVIGVAKTGSGKTLAFILPMFRHIKDQRPVENLEGPIGLILAPTRELATQIHRDCKPYLKALNLRAVCAYGGAPIKDQISELKRGAEIVVCTPGRFIDLLAANSGRVTNLRRVTYVVLDEADRMFDMGFEPQITKLLNNIRPDHQTVLFSATFPRTMEALARKALTKPVEIIVGGRSVVAPEITQVVEVRTEASKFKRLLELLGDLHDKDEDARSLIFVERQETADSMLMELLQKGYPSVSVHGGREQIDRDQAVADFKAGIVPVMVATSVAARGLDVKQLKLVINYDSPNHHEDYVHRAGRTGRAGNTGTAVTFVTPEQDRFAKFLIKALTDSTAEVPEELTNLKESHDEKVKAGEAKKIGSGFGGRGIERLDAARDAARAIERKQHKIGDEPDDDDEDGDKKKTTDKKESAVDEMVAKAAGMIKDRDSKPEVTDGDELLPAGLSNALKDAMTIHRAATPPTQSGTKVSGAFAKAQAVAATLDRNLGKASSARPGVPVDNRGPDAGAFHATLEINDFPQKARWGVTNRTNVAKILDATGTSITTKGNYYVPPKQPQPGEPPKLYILVEGDTEVQVESAMREMTRLLKEGAMAANADANRAGPSGRYSVV